MKDTPLHIIHQVICDYFDIDLEYIFINNRKRSVVTKRQWFHYFARKLNSMSYEKIGKYNKSAIYNHCRVLHGHGVISNLVDVDNEFKAIKKDLLLLIKLEVDSREINWVTNMVNQFEHEMNIIKLEINN